MQPQPLIAVRNVEYSSRWYQSILGLQSGHGGPEYEQLMFAGRMVMQLHDWHAHEHPHIGSPDIPVRGNGAVLWFQTDRFDEIIECIHRHKARILEGPQINPTANHREVWLEDPDGYVVVIAGPYGDTGQLTPRSQ